MQVHSSVPRMSWVKDEVIAQLLRGVPVSLSSLGRRCLDVMSVAVVGHLGSSSMHKCVASKSAASSLRIRWQWVPHGMQ